MNEQPDEETHRAKSGIVLSTRDAVTMEFGYSLPLSMWMCSLNQQLTKPCTSSIFNRGFIIKT